MVAARNKILITSIIRLISLVRFQVEKPFVKGKAAQSREIIVTRI